MPVKQSIVPSQEQKLISTHTFLGTHNFRFFISDNVEQLTLKMKIGKRENHPGNKVLITDPTVKILFNSFIASDGEVHDISFTTKSKGLYSMNVSDQKITFSIQFPDWLPFVVDKFVIPDWQKKVYFYVPQDTKKIAMLCEGVVPVKIYDGDGK